MSILARLRYFALYPPHLLIPFAQPCWHELSGAVQPLSGCLRDPPQSGGGRDLRSNYLTSTPPPARLRLPRVNDRPGSPLHACSDGRKTRREARTRRTRFSARHTPRPESGRGRSEVERRPPPDEASARRLFAAAPQLQHSTPLPRPSHERRPLPDSGRGRMSTDCARDVLPGRGVVIP